MANQLIFGANITPANTAMEVSINGGTTFTPLAYTTVGSNQQGILTGVAATSYAIGQLIERAVGYPATALANTVSVTVAAATIPAPTVTPVKPHFKGDSITSGAVATSWVETEKTTLSTTHFPLAGYNNQAISGQSSNQQLATLATDVIAAKGTGGGTFNQDVLIVFVGVNDLRIGDAGTPHAGTYRTKHEIAHDILEMGRQARLNGFKPILFTVFPDRRQNTANPAEDTRMLTLQADVNTILLANYATYGYVAVKDWSSDTNVGGPNTPLTNAGTYYLTDKIHPSNQGEIYIGQQAAPVIQQVANMALTAFTDPGQYPIPATGPTPAARQAATFTHLVNVSATGNTLTKTAGGAVFNAGAVATKSYGAVAAGNTFANSFDFLMDNATAGFVLGVHGGADAGADYVEVVGGFAIQTSSSGWRAFMGGSPISSFAAFTTNDRMLVSFTTTQAVVSINGTTALTATFTLPVNALLDASMDLTTAVIKDVYIAISNPVAVT